MLPSLGLSPFAKIMSIIVPIDPLKSPQSGLNCFPHIWTLQFRHNVTAEGVVSSVKWDVTGFFPVRDNVLDLMMATGFVVEDSDASLL